MERESWRNLGAIRTGAAGRADHPHGELPDYGSSPIMVKAPAPPSPELAYSLRQQRLLAEFGLHALKTRDFDALLPARDGTRRGRPGSPDVQGARIPAGPEPPSGVRQRRLGGRRRGPCDRRG